MVSEYTIDIYCILRIYLKTLMIYTSKYILRSILLSVISSPRIRKINIVMNSIFSTKYIVVAVVVAVVVVVHVASRFFCELRVSSYIDYQVYNIYKYLYYIYIYLVHVYELGGLNSAELGCGLGWWWAGS